jgi:hypothetical protein
MVLAMWKKRSNICEQQRLIFLTSFHSYVRERDLAQHLLRCPANLQLQAIQVHCPPYHRPSVLNSHPVA